MVRKSIFTKRAKEERSIEGFTRNIRFLHSTLKHTVLTDVRVTIYIIQSWTGETCCWSQKLSNLGHSSSTWMEDRSSVALEAVPDAILTNVKRSSGRNSKLAAEHKGAGGQRVWTHAAKRGHMLRSTWRNCLLFPSILLNFTSHRALQ